MDIMNIEKINSKKTLEKIKDIWNSEFGLIYPISDALMERNFQNAYSEASFIVKENDEIVGFIISKIYEEEYHKLDYKDIGWISLIYVCPQYRNKGIGSKLLNRVESEFSKLRKEIIYIGKDFYNFFPGLPIDLKKSLSWFEKRGYKRLYNTCDLIRNKDKKITLRNQNIKYVLANQINKNDLIEFLDKNWPGRWTKEAMDYFDQGGNGREYLVGLDEGKICAFAKVNFPSTPTKYISYNLTWREKFDSLGGIGPLGVNINYRGQKIGYDIIAEAINRLIDSGADNIIIDWTNLLDFYRKFEFEVWKSYEYLQKKL